MSNGHGGFRMGAGRPSTSGKSVYNDFTEKQIKVLIDSPYVYSISKKSISYTKEFKELFWQRYIDGITPKQIFEDAKLDTTVITQSRIYSFTKSLKQQYEKNLAFTDGNEPQLEKTHKQFNFPVPPRRANNAKIPVLSDADIANLINQVAYMSQELAFLKKIILTQKEEK